MADPASSLSASLSLRVAVDEESLRSIARGIDRAIDVEAKRLVVFIAEKGAQILRSIDAGLGRRVIAANWAVGDPVDNPGSVSIEVYNRLEDQVIHTKSNAPNSQKTYAIKGSSLLSILNYGAEAHDIKPRNPNKPLQFPIEVGVSQSRFVGTTFTSKGIEVGSFTNPNGGGNMAFGMIRHPGVVGSRSLQAARLRLLAAIEPAAADVGRNINVAINKEV